MIYRLILVRDCPGNPTHVAWEACEFGFVLTENGCESSQPVRHLRGYCDRDEGIGMRMCAYVNAAVLHGSAQS